MLAKAVTTVKDSGQVRADELVFGILIFLVAEYAAAKIPFNQVFLKVLEGSADLWLEGFRSFFEVIRLQIVFWWDRQHEVTVRIH